MITETLILDNINKVKSFVDIAITKNYDIDLVSGKYIVNGKSIMGVFSLDLTKPVTMNAYPEEEDGLLDEISEYIFSEQY